jgi:hypothetical protein
MVAMKFPQKLEEYRLRIGDYASRTGDRFGVFFMPGPCGRALRMMASDGNDPLAQGWEHVSVSTERRPPPNWQEMCFVKDLFWSEEECVVQFHPAKSRHINNYSTCLHLWRRIDIPTPPDILVGYKELGTLK